jgi:gliding motility-associated-like protein
VTTLFTIEQPAAALTVVATKCDITCITGNNDGIITAVATGGWDNKYQYQLVLGGTTLIDYSDQSVFSGLSAGVYTINVKDGNDCIATTTATLVVPAPIVITTSPDVMLTCYGDKSATITVTSVTGGQGSNYLYTLNVISANPVISSGPQASPVFTDLGAGTYTVTVTDGFNCSGTSANIVIDQPTEVKATLVKSKGVACTTSAQLTLSAVGGSAPYTYSNDASFATVLGSFTASVTFDVAPGTYKYYVKDAQGCVSVASNDIKVNPLEPLTLTLDLSNAVVKCTGDNSAVIVATVTGGLGNYQYTLYNGAGTVIAGPQPENRFEGLVAGTYSVQVNSEDCTTPRASITITEPATHFDATVTVTNVFCFGEKTGKIEVVGSGGTGAYVYSISPRSDQYFDKGLFENLEVGTYTILANDENGCLFRRDIVITGPTAPLQVAETPGSVHGEECLGDSNGGFTIDIVGGTPAYTVSLDNIAGTYEPVTTLPHPFDNIKGGIHKVYVKDANGCTFEISVNVPLPVDLTSEVDVVYGCETNTVTVNVLDKTIDPADVDYSLDDIAGPYKAENEFKDVLPGAHKVYVRHTNSCIYETLPFTIEGFAKLGINVVSAGVKEMNVIEVIGVGGKKDYLYSFNGEPFTSDNKYKIYKSGDYPVIVRDQNGCEATVIVPMIYVDVCVPDHFTPNGDGQFDEWGPGCTNIYNNLTFEIFDRYGRVIAKYHYGQKWDGKYDGAELPTGDYWYVLKLNDEKDAREFVGHFTLYR